MSVHEIALQAARDWLQSANGGLADAKVIVADDKGPRPTLPYVTVRVSLQGVKVGQDEIVDGLSSGTPTLKVHGNRRGTVSVQGFGAGSDVYIETASLALRTPTIQAILDAAGLSVTPIGGINNITTLLDTGREPRFSQDYDFAYELTSSTETATEMTSAEVDVDLEVYDGDADPLSTTATAP